MSSLAEYQVRGRPVGVATVNSSWQYLSINETMAAFHDSPVQYHIGHFVVDVVQKSAHHLVLPAYQKVIGTGIAVENLMVEALAGARLRRCLVSYLPVKVDRTSLWGVQVFAVDITPNAPKSPAILPKFELTAMEQTVLKLIGDCKSNKEIACLLDVCISTVSTHRKAICRKLDLHSAPELVRFAAENFLASSPLEGIVKLP